MKIEIFSGSGAAAREATEAIAARLTPPGPKRLVVTGGRTPGPVYDRLSALDVGWDRIDVTLSDERFVPTDSKDSNERLVRERLLRGRAAEARFTPLKGAGPTVSDDAVGAEPKIKALAPFDAALLGMGDDGHICSLFPGAAGLEAALDPRGSRFVVPVEQAGLDPYVPRISLTLRALAGAGLVIVFASGRTKRETLERMSADPAFKPPVAALSRLETSTRVLWWE